MSHQTSIIDVIEHYKRSILNSSEDESRLLHCIDKLYKLPVNVEHLQETGVGKVVNTLRKGGGEAGIAAKALITKWKSMVAAKKAEICTPNNSLHEDYNPAAAASANGNNTQVYNDYHNVYGDSRSHESSHSVNSLTKDPAKIDSPNGLSTMVSPINGKSSSNTNHFSHEIHKDSDNKRGKYSKDHNSHERHGTKHSKDRHKGEEKVSSSSKHSSSKRSKRTDMEEQNDSFDMKEKLAQLNECNSQAKARDKEEDKIKDKDKHRHHRSGGERHKSSHRSSSTSNEKNKAYKMDSSSHHDNSPTTSNSEPNKSREVIKECYDGGQKNLSSPSCVSESGNKKYSSNCDRKRSHCNANVENNEHREFKAPSQKLPKLNQKYATSPEVLSKGNTNSFEDDGDSFDSSTGANFADVLGMLSMQPTKKSKKYTSSNSSNTTNSKHSTTSTTTIPTTSSSITKALNIDQNGSRASSLQSPNSYTSSSLKANNLGNNSFGQTSLSSSSKSSPFTSTKPDLLGPTAKLEPLDPNIALELPAISLNYRPRPLNQTVMDCVFNNNTASSSKASRTTLSDAEALNLGISSKTVRTKIYSGSKTGQILQVPSLFDLCIRLLQKNIDALEYTGGVPFDVLKPVLERATPQQLLIFENYNPYLMDDSDVLWQQHVQRNYRTQRRLENETWREMFLRCQDDQERKLSFLADSIKQSQKVASAPIRKTQLAFVDTLVKPPRNIQRKQEQYGTQSKLVASPAARVAALAQVAPNAIKNGDMRLKVPANVKDYAQINTSNARPKKAPLMQKTLQFIRGRHRR